VKPTPVRAAAVRLFHLSPPRLALAVLVAMLAVLAILLATPLTARAQDAGPLPEAVGPLLQRALTAAGQPMLQADGTYAVWVHFADRGRTEAQLAADLAAVRAELPERTLARRAKMLPGGPAIGSPDGIAADDPRLVTARDLPPAAQYVDAVAATGAEPRRQSRWLNAASFDATREQIAAIAQLPFVREVELVAKFRKRDPEVGQRGVPLTESELRAAREAAAGRWALNYGGSLDDLEQINVPPVHELGITGQGVIIGMLDSGFKTTHEALAGIPVLARYDFINDDDVVENEPGDSPTQHDHGTKTMSTAMGFRDGALVGPAFGASAILAKTEDVSQEVPIEEDNWVAGLEWVESLGADVVSSSLGYYDWYEFSDMDGNTAVTTIAADLAVGRGVTVVNSAGNERGWGFGHIIAPADGDSVIAVGAVDIGGDIASFSSPGPSYDGRIKPDVSALGVSNHVVSVTSDDGYTSASGTSFSCPLTSGVAALVLARAPQLTPIQVREALRATADRAANPDNDYGWGILDALAAVTYWGASIAHEPLGDTEDVAGPYVIDAVITDRLPLDPAQMDVVWRTGGGAWQRTPLVLVGGDQWRAELPGQPAGTEVAYYLEVTDTAQITTRLPFAGEADPFAFAVGPDTEAPVLVHQPLGDQPLVTWPPVITATVTDNLGLDRVELVYTLNGGAPVGPFQLQAQDDAWSLVFPVPAEQVTLGDQFSYTITAYDAAQQPNATVSGPHPFEVIDTLGVVLVIDDQTAASGADVKYDGQKNALAPRTGRTSAATLATWLREAGYVADEITAGEVTPEAFDPYQVVAYAAGSSTSPASSAQLRDALVGWAQQGGKLLVEGGELGYDALSSPGYPALASEVLHATGWQTDNAGPLQIAGGQETHPLVIRPHALPASIALDYTGYGDQDAMQPDTDAVVVYGTANYPGAAGVLVFDDNPAPQAGQIVYLALDLEALDPAIGRQLAENALAYLLAGEGPATASIAGTVTVAGSTDNSGVTVSAGPQHSVVTGPDGAYELAALYGGTYTVTAHKEGYATAVQQVTVADGQALTGVDFALLPELTINLAVQPELAIPDANPTGITSVITVAESGQLSGITVDIDISHTWIGDLSVVLTSPAGTQVTLHNRSGSSADDIVGNWPQTLDVDGPGALADLLGEDVAGDWTLRVADHAGSDTGTLHAWGLNLTIPGAVTAAGDGVPLVTRLAGAHPNPFNPQTTVAFDLARGGRVQLGVYDLRGRLVRLLVDGELMAGRHTVRWDGRDQGGRGAASGVYLCRLEAPAIGGAARMLKLTLVK